MLNEKLRLAFLFGAGASRGCLNVSPAAPPLGDGLLRELVAHYPLSWGTVSPRLQKIMAEDFEAGMSEVWAELGKRHMLVVDMASYFCKFELSGDHDQNLYVRLVEAVDRLGLSGQALFGTLNYECLLEAAINAATKRKVFHVGLDPSRYPDAPTDDVRVLKIHGSCNYLARLPMSNMQILPSVSCESDMVSAPIDPIPLAKVRADFERGSVTPPLMAAYEASKPVITGREVKHRLYWNWANWVEGSELLIIVGAKPNLNDEHVWCPIDEFKGQVVYVGGTEGDYDYLSKGLRDRFTFAGLKFSEGLPFVLNRLEQFAKGP